MTKLLDPKNDVVFQKLFGIKNHKKILISFLNSILNLTGKNAIKEVEFEEKGTRHFNLKMFCVFYF